MPLLKLQHPASAIASRMLPPFLSLSLSSLCVSSILPIVVEERSSLSKGNTHLNLLKTLFYKKKLYFHQENTRNKFLFYAADGKLPLVFGSLAGTRLHCIVYTVN
jgi:hypothetical protein